MEKTGRRSEKSGVFASARAHERSARERESSSMSAKGTLRRATENRLPPARVRPRRRCGQAERYLASEAAAIPRQYPASSSNSRAWGSPSRASSTSDRKSTFSLPPDLRIALAQRCGREHRFGTTASPTTAGRPLRRNDDVAGVPHTAMSDAQQLALGHHADSEPGSTSEAEKTARSAAFSQEVLGETGGVTSA